MNELVILKYLINREQFEKYSRYLNLDYLKHNFPEIYKIYLVLAEAHAERVNLTGIDDLKAMFFASYPALKRTEVESMNILFDRAKGVELSQEVIDAVFAVHRERGAAFLIAGKGFDVAEGKASWQELTEAVSAYNEGFSVSDVAIPFVTDSLTELNQLTYGKPGVKWGLKTLRKMMGSLRKGDMGFVFARPEVGKTTFLADQCSYFAHQLDGPLLHFNNEEYGPKVKLRYYQAALGLTTKELFQDIRKHEKDFLDFTNGNIKIYDAASISRETIEDICERLQPKMLVFDSIDKIKGFKDDRDDLVYKQIYAWSREMAKTYGPVIGVCHASVSAERKRWLEMDDVAYAKTAKQGEADWILGIGASYDDGEENVRHFHLSKNKLMGDEDMDETLRHGKLPVLLKPEIARYEDIMEFS